MCSILFSTKDISEYLYDANWKMKRRGPDNTTYTGAHGKFFLHNLLSITGAFTTQPVRSDCGRYTCLFNGEIYNWMPDAHWKNENLYILAKYNDLGTDSFKKIDGEFAIIIIDHEREECIIASDTFRTKPLYYYMDDHMFAAASYRSALEPIVRWTANIKKIKTNTVMKFCLKDYKLLEEKSHTEFDLKQHKTSFDDWCIAFEDSVRKRSHNMREKIFIGLSCGHDSGAISAALNKQKCNYSSYTVRSDEDMDIVNARFAINSQSGKNKCELLSLGEEEFRKAHRSMYMYVENQKYEHQGQKDVLDDKASVGLAKICQFANNNNEKIYISGSGADEIVSCYSLFGNPIYGHVTFNGIFPEDLSTVFPWHSFYNGTQASYLSKEECVNGAYGIESRYPFLDKAVVQEFLWLSHDLKNSEYKAPIEYYLRENNYPFLSRVKKGFSADKNLK